MRMRCRTIVKGGWKDENGDEWKNGGKRNKKDLVGKRGKK
jgi:hypothetical protein